MAIPSAVRPIRCPDNESNVRFRGPAVLVPEYRSNPGRPRMMSTTATGGPRHGQSAPRLHLRSEARRLRPHKRALRRRSAIEAVIGHMNTGGHRGRCHARVRRSVSVRIFPISVFGQLPKEPICSRLRPVRGWPFYRLKSEATAAKP
jgi:hypothetical protein